MRRLAVILVTALVGSLAYAGAGAGAGGGRLAETAAASPASATPAPAGLPSLVPPAGRPGPARLDSAVADAVGRAAPGASLDLILSLERPADRHLQGVLNRLGLWSRTFEHLPVAAVRLPVA